MLNVNGIDISTDFPLMWISTSELIATDIICLRCYKAGISFPQEWKDYTISLRTIIKNADKTLNEMPIKPDMPSDI